MPPAKLTAHNLTGHAELMTSGGERLVRKVVSTGKNAVYVAIGINGSDEGVGFFIKNGKPVPTNPHKHLRLTLVYKDRV